MLQYVTDHGDSGFLNVDKNPIDCGDDARNFATEYFDTYPRADCYQVCFTDFERKVSTIFEVTRDLSLETNAY